MGSPTTPTHGKFANLYRRRPGGFSGSGLNDATWGTGYNAAATAYFEVVIDTVGTPDKFKWRKNGGSWTTTVSITGSAQTLSDGQTITFAATTGHTLNDQWVIGNLYAEACTESGVTAQITDATRRLINPNVPPTWTDSGGKQRLEVNYTNGFATFAENVTAVTVTGNNGFIPAASLEKVGYLLGWTLDLALELAEMNYAGQAWKQWLPGMASGKGSAEAYFIAGKSVFNTITAEMAGGNAYYLLELFNYDPDQDQTGDHFIAWVTFDSFNLAPAMNAVVKETVNFQTVGPVSFTGDA
jgi:hypothetical protein